MIAVAVFGELVRPDDEVDPPVADAVLQSDTLQLVQRPDTSLCQRIEELLERDPGLPGLDNRGGRLGVCEVCEPGEEDCQRRGQIVGGSPDRDLH